MIADPRSLRIAILAWRDLDHPQAGGSEVVVDRLACGLVDRGHRVTLLAGGKVGTRGYPVWRTGGTYSQYLRAPWTFRRRAASADVVIDVENGIPFFAPLWQRAPVVCLVHHVHTEQWSMQFPAPVAAAGRVLESRVMPRLYARSTFVAVSSSTARELEHLGVDASRVTTIEMGAVPVMVSGSRAEAPRFLVLGRLVPHKRVERALALWPRVRQRTGGELVIVGDGPELDRLRVLSGPGVRFAGAVSDTEKGRHLGEAWLLVHPAHHEGWGTVIMEAAGAGVPTVGYDVPGVRDSVVHGVTGLLAADDDAFVEAWTDLALDVTRRVEMGEAARARAESFTWPRAVDAMESVVTAAARGADR